MSGIVAHSVAACKFDYEYMGKSAPELAKQYGFPLFTIQDEIDQGNWQRKLEPTVLPDTKDMQVFAEELEALTRSKLSIISLFRQIENQPLYAQIEKALLDKILLTINNLQDIDDKIATKLLNLAKTVEAIQAREPIALADELKKAIDGKGPSVLVQIQNQVN